MEETKLKTTNHVFVYPTDTVWGMGASIYSEIGNGYIRRLKNRNKNTPFSVLFSNTEMLLDYISFPKNYDLNSMKNLFKLEVSLLIPLVWLKKEIPSWVYSNSKYLAVRYVENKETKLVTIDSQAPVTTTSLNLSGTPPITNARDAESFCLNIKVPFRIYGLDIQDSYLSGESSTLIMVSDNGINKIIRRGRRFREIEKHKLLFST